MAGRYDTEKSVAMEAVREAAVLCRSVQRGIEPETLSKKDRSPVTVADFGSQALVCRTIDMSFPGDPVIGEENASMLRKDENVGIREKVLARVREQIVDASEEQVLAWIDRGFSRDHSERFWTLDPIDGTKGFLRGEQYAIALALVVDGRVDVAVLGCPNLSDPHDGSRRGVAFAAVRGEGVTTSPLFGDAGGLPVRVSAVEDASEARICESVESWDHAAGMLVVEEAGGRVTDIHGVPLDFSYGGGLEANVGVVATNGRLHDRVLEALRETGVATPLQG
jgi:3'(2'), 5'-bisphosphate nucleotidase